MTTQFVLALGKEAIILTLTAAAPMLLLGLIVGFIIAIFQAVTQIHEMTLTFVPKIIAVGVALLIFFPWIVNMLVGFTHRIFSQLPAMVG